MHAGTRRLPYRAEGTRAPPRGQGARHLRRRRADAPHRDHRQAVGFRRRAARPDPRQGAGAERHLQLLVRAHPAPGAESPDRAGARDENISFEAAAALIGPELAARVRDAALELYAFASEHARSRGIIVADTKFEFGVDEEGSLTLIDEVLTPDSSRFWPADSYREGVSPPSFDKQFVRDYLESLDWNKQAPGPRLPPEIIARTSDKYREALARLTG